MAEAGARPADTVMIGDTVYDIEMAVAARARAIGVAWGYHAPAELLAAGAEAVAANARRSWGRCSMDEPVSDDGRAQALDGDQRRPPRRRGDGARSDC